MAEQRAEQEHAGSVAANNWLARGMRVTCFCAPQRSIDAASWWASVTGGEPDSSTVRPKIGAQVHEGALGEWRLALSVLPGRIDWRLSAPGPKSPESLDASLPPTCGPFPRAGQELLALAKRWSGLEDCPPSTRLAVGAELVQPVPDKAEGYRLATRYLGATMKIDPEGSSDLLYRINRSRACSIGDDTIPVNRLSTWSILRVTGQAVLDVTGRELGRVFTSTAFALSLELDINTGPEFSGELPAALFGEALDTLFDLATEIAVKGDVP